MKRLSELKVAIVCDWLTGTGGAEQVILQLHRLFPKAPIYTSQFNPDPKIWYGDTWFSDADVRTGWLQKLPSTLKKFLPPLRAWYFSHLDLSKYDLVISISGAEAKGVKTGPNTTHISYILAPTHYCWSRYEEYRRAPGFGMLDPIARLGLRLLVGPMRHWDYRAAQRPTFLLADSAHIMREVKKYYSRDSVVVYPPVDTERFTVALAEAKAQNQKRHGFVVVGRQTPYKRIDLAVAACTHLNLPLTVIGTGPDHNKLVAMAGPTVTFITTASNNEVARYFATAEAVLFPSNTEDFGITPVEAMAAGAPVIAYAAGGPLETIVAGKTGEFFKELTAEALTEVLRNFNPEKYKTSVITQQVQNFSVDTFRNQMTAAVARSINEKP